MNRRLLSLTAVLFLLLPASLNRAGTVEPESPARSPRGLGQGDHAINERNSFSERGLRGRWTVLAVPDPEEEGVAPVVVQKVSSFIGAGNWKGNMKLIGGKLRNDSTKQVRAVQLEWAVTPQDDEEGVLLEGVTPPFAARLSPNEVQVMDFPVVDFKHALRSLTKDGALHGDFRVQLRASAVLFEDGAVWKQGEVFSFLKRARYSAITTRAGCDNDSCQAQYTFPYVSCVENPRTTCDPSPCNEYGCNCGNELCIVSN